jgi:hypothetical protein
MPPSTAGWVDPLTTPIGQVERARPQFADQIVGQNLLIDSGIAFHAERG